MTDEPTRFDRSADNTRHRISAGFFRRTATGWESARIARGTDELVFVVECHAARRDENSASELAIELWRGNQLRDGRIHQAPLCIDSSVRAAYRIAWHDPTAASTRLRCRVLVEGCEFGWWELLLQPVSFDAQGHLSHSPIPGESHEMLLAYDRELAALGNHGDECK